MTPTALNERKMSQRNIISLCSPTFALRKTKAAMVK